MSAHSKLEEEIGLLAGLPREELVTYWHRIYRRSPPKGVKRGLLERIYRLAPSGETFRRIVACHQAPIERSRGGPKCQRVGDRRYE